MFVFLGPREQNSKQTIAVLIPGVSLQNLVKSLQKPLTVKDVVALDFFKECGTCTYMHIHSIYSC